jgi:hypothetical protein
MSDSQKSMRAIIEPTLEKMLRSLFFWTTSEKEFGKMVVLLHILLFWTFHSTVVMVNIINVPTILIIGILILALTVLAQHYFLGVCVLSSIEKRVNGEAYPLAEPVLQFFGIPISVENVRGVTCLLITIYMISFSLQLLRIGISRT